MNLIELTFAYFYTGRGGGGYRGGGYRDDRRGDYRDDRRGDYRPRGGYRGDRYDGEGREASSCSCSSQLSYAFVRSSVCLSHEYVFFIHHHDALQMTVVGDIAVVRDPAVVAPDTAGAAVGEYQL